MGGDEKHFPRWFARGLERRGGANGEGKQIKKKTEYAGLGETKFFKTTYANGKKREKGGAAPF